MTVYSDYRDFLDRNPGAKIYMATTKAPNVYSDVKYEPDCYIMFGPGEPGNPGGNTGGKPGDMCENPDVGGDTFTESFELSGSYPL